MISSMCSSNAMNVKKTRDLVDMPGLEPHLCELVTAIVNYYAADTFSEGTVEMCWSVVWKM